MVALIVNNKKRGLSTSRLCTEGSSSLCVYGHHLQQNGHQPGRLLPMLLVSQLNRQKNDFFPPVPVRSRDSLTIPSRVSPPLPHAFGDGVHLYREPPSGQSQLLRVTQLRTDGVHCRESAGAGPVVPKVVRATGAAFSGIAMEIFLWASLFPHPLLV